MAALRNQQEMQCHLVSIVTEVSVDNWECIYPGLKGWGRRNNLAGCYSDRISPNFWDKGQNRIFICLVDSDTYMILTSKVHYRCLWSVCSLGEKTEKAMAPHSSVLAWRIPRTEEPGGLPSTGSHRVRHDWSDLAAAAAARMIFSGIYIKKGITRVY